MATSNFNFTLLAGSDEAGYNSINTLITSIDNELYDRVAIPGMTMVWRSVGGSTLTGSGWTDLGATPAGLPAVSSPYTWIQKDAT